MKRTVCDKVIIIIIIVIIINKIDGDCFYFHKTDGEDGHV